MSKRSPWPFAIVGLLGMNVTIVGITVFYATSDRSMAVEPNYYQRALAWDRNQIQSTRNAQLGWTLTLEASNPRHGRSDLALSLRDRSGKPIEDARIEALAFHNSRASERQTLLLSSMGKGEYSGTLAADRDGLWHFQVTIQHGTNTFTQVVERSLISSDPRGTP